VFSGVVVAQGSTSGESTPVKIADSRRAIADLLADLTIAPKPKDSVPIPEVFNQSKTTIRERFGQTLVLHCLNERQSEPRM